MQISQLNGNTLVDATFHEYINTVGAVIFSFDDSFSPSALWGGSWTRLMDRFLIGSGGTYETGETGGETNVTLTVDQMPSHTHGELVTASSPTGGWYSRVVADSGPNEPTVEIRQTAQTGGGQAHNNMPPYIGCKIWRKIA